MHKSALLVLALLPASSLAQPTPTVPIRKQPPPISRATSPDELIGNWAISMTTRMTTCAPMADPPARSVDTWTIDHVGGTLTVKTITNLELTGPSGTSTHGTFRHVLAGKQKPRGNQLQLNHFIKDKLSGQLLRAEVVDKRSSDPVCVTLFDVSGRKLP
jgi:hypothetical protein